MTNDVVDLPPPSATVPLASGRYRNPAFEPSLSLEVDGRWFHVQAVPGFFDVEIDPGRPDVIAVQLARPVGAATAAALVGSIRERAGVRTTAPEPIDLAGSAATSVLVETVDPDLAANRFVPVLDVALGPISIASGRRLWVGALDTPVGLLAVLVGGSARGWAAAEEAAAPVLASLRFEP